MKTVPWFKTKRAWRNSLMVTTGLSLFSFLASLLWNAGHPEWAFVLLFMAIWLLISMIWSNDDFIEESSSILASIVDHNFDQVHERLEQLEREANPGRSSLKES
jgi:hypothetical protein